MRRVLRDVAAVVWPRTCPVCGITRLPDERVMCLHCLYGLPRTGIHTDPFNVIHKRLIDIHIPVEHAAAWFHYDPSTPYSRIIRAAKYGREHHILRYGAMMYADEVGAAFFSDIDALVPIPMHPFKMMRRGFNQARVIALGLSEATGLPVVDALRTRHLTASQTKRSSGSRRGSVEGRYVVRRPATLRGRHLLIVDDVITTGATMHEALHALAHAVPDVRLSVLALGLANG